MILITMIPFITILFRAGEPVNFLAAPAPALGIVFKRFRLWLLFFQAASALAPYFFNGSGSCVFLKRLQLTL